MPDEMGEQRIERWMLEVAKRLSARGLAGAKPTYDGRVLGDRIALSWGGAEDCGEVLILRREKAARMILLASTSAAARAFRDALAGLHEEVRRLHNAKRRFMHRLERMATHLADELELRARDAPRAEWAKVSELIGQASLLIGIEVHTFGGPSDEEAGEAGASVDADVPIRKGLQKRYKTRYAVTLPSKTGVRAALWSPARRMFVASPVSANRVRARCEGLQRPPSDFALALPVALLSRPADAAVVARVQGDVEVSAARETIDASADVVETAIEVADAAGACSDIGGLSFPDCSFDVPDCSF
jgi:hypothetical protein